MTHLFLREPPQDALEYLRSLQVLASPLDCNFNTVQFYYDPVRDPRRVRIGLRNPTEDWDASARRGEDYWEKADELIRRHRAGENISEL